MKKVEMYGYNIGGQTWKVEVCNKKEGIEFSNVTNLGRYAPRRAHDIKQQILSTLKYPYSSIDVETREGAKELKKELEERILEKQAEIEYLKMGIQLCKRNKVTLKT